MLDVGFAADGTVIAKSAIGTPLEAGGKAGAGGALRAHNTTLPAKHGGGGGAPPRLGGPSGGLPLVLLASCVMAALVAVAGAYQALPWLA